MTAVRRPQQARSQARFEALLDAVGTVLADRGPGAGMRDITEEAGVSVGWAYRYFADRDALLDGFVLRALERADARFATIADRARDPIALSEELVDAVVELLRSEPGLPTAWALRRGAPAVRSADAGQNTTVAAMVHAFGADPVRARVTVEAVAAALDLAFEEDPAGDDAILAEARRLPRLLLGDDAPR